MRRLRILIVIAGAALVLPASALGDHWFYRGWLPTDAGARAVHKDTGPYDPVWLEQSWEVNTHDMNMLQIWPWGEWTSHRISGPPWDQIWQVSIYSWKRAGCQNPLGFYTVWVNCAVWR